MLLTIFFFAFFAIGVLSVDIYAFMANQWFGVYVATLFLALTCDVLYMMIHTYLKDRIPSKSFFMTPATVAAMAIIVMGYTLNNPDYLIYPKMFMLSTGCITCLLILAYILKPIKNQNMNKEF